MSDEVGGFTGQLYRVTITYTCDSASGNRRLRLTQLLAVVAQSHEHATARAADFVRKSNHFRNPEILVYGEDRPTAVLDARGVVVL